MAKIPFHLLEEPETRQPSKVRLVLFISIILLFIVAVAFIVLYAVEKTHEKATDSTSETANGTCTSRGCVISAAGILPELIRLYQIKTLQISLERYLYLQKCLGPEQNALNFASLASLSRFLKHSVILGLFYTCDISLTPNFAKCKVTRNDILYASYQMSVKYVL